MPSPAPIILWRRCAAAAFASALLLAAPAAGWTARAEAPSVVASIKPVHALVAAAMAGMGAPRLLLPGGASPHTSALRPSDMRALADASLIVWVGPALETYLAKPLADPRLARKTLTLMDDGSVATLPRRRGGLWAEGEAGHGHGGRAGEHAGGHWGALDPHLWLDPANARAIVRAVVTRLGEIDPAGAARYAENGRAAERALERLETEIASAVAPARGGRYLVFHDGYQYFERRFGLDPAGAVVIDPERPPGAGRLKALRARITGGHIACVFAEPQFAADRVSALVLDTGARVATLDAYGTDIAAGPEAYGAILRTLAGSFGKCLAR
jgi:zinc transport system substrate-binding protein